MRKKSPEVQRAGVEGVAVLEVDEDEVEVPEEAAVQEERVQREARVEETNAFYDDTILFLCGREPCMTKSMSQ